MDQGGRIALGSFAVILAFLPVGTWAAPPLAEYGQWTFWATSFVVLLILGIILLVWPNKETTEQGSLHPLTGSARGLVVKPDRAPFI